jgi:hypothetical protein
MEVPMSENKNVTFRLPDTLMDRLKAAADHEKRSTSQQAELYLEQALNDREKVTAFFPTPHFRNMPASFFDPAKPFRLASRGRGREDFHLEKGPLLYLRVWPEKEAPALDYPDAFNLLRQGISLMPTFAFDSQGSSHDVNEFGAVVFSTPADDKIIFDLTQLFLNRELWALNSWMLSPTHNTERRIFMVDVERTFAIYLPKYLEFAERILKLEPPFHIEAGAAPIKGYLIAANPNAIRPTFKEILKSHVVCSETISSRMPAEIERVLLAIFQGFYAAAGLRRPKA